MAGDIQSNGLEVPSLLHSKGCPCGIRLRGLRSGFTYAARIPLLLGVFEKLNATFRSFFSGAIHAANLSTTQFLDGLAESAHQSRNKVLSIHSLGTRDTVSLPPLWTASKECPQVYKPN